VLTYLGMKGEDALALLREKRPGALFKEQNVLTEEYE